MVRICQNQFVVMLSQPPSPLPQRLASPEPRGPLQLPLSPPPQTEKVSKSDSEPQRLPSPVPRRRLRLPLSPPPQPEKGSVSDSERSAKRQKDVYVKDFDLETMLYKPFNSGDEIVSRDVWNKYFQQIRDSEGFDIGVYPGSAPVTSVFPMAYCKNSREFAEEALQKYNEKHGTKYEFDEIVKVNGYCTGCFHYYITFTVTDMNGEEKYFQAEVVQALNQVDLTLKFPIIRPRVNGSLGI